MKSIADWEPSTEGREPLSDPAPLFEYLLWTEITCLPQLLLKCNESLENPEAAELRHQWPLWEKNKDGVLRQTMLWVFSLENYKGGLQFTKDISRAMATLEEDGKLQALGRERAFKLNLLFLPILLGQPCCSCPVLNILFLFNYILWFCPPIAAAPHLANSVGNSRICLPLLWSSVTLVLTFR